MTTDPMAQDIIRCDLCPDEDCKSPVEMVCQTCNINLCSECVGRHISAELSLKHNVVGVKFIKSEMPSFSCKFHPKSNCELHCQECSVPVCVKCLATGNHKAHDVVEISSIYNKQIEFIKQDTQELKSVLAPTYEKMAQDLEKRKTNLPVSYGDFKSSILKRGKEWHDTVDVIIQKLLTQAEQMEKDDLKLLSDLHSDIRDILSSIQETIQENLDSLKLQTGTEIINYRSRNEQLRKVPKTFDIAGPVFLPMVIKEEQLRQLFGEIKSSMKIEVQGYNITCPTAKQVIYQPKVDKTISCPTNALKISCVPNTEEFFIKYNNSIQHLDNNGKMLNELRIKSGRKANINLTVTRNKKLIYSDYHDKSVNIVNCDNIDTIIRFESWRPLAVCSTSSDELLVSMKSNDESQSKVVRYNQSTVIQEIQFDTTGEPLYEDPHYLAENKNLQVCVSDSKKKTVIVTDKAGKHLFSYKGNLSIRKYKTFEPCGIATDSAWHIVVLDNASNCVHIINHEGGFVGHIDNCSLYDPYDLSISDNDMLYVADLTNKVKVIRYLK